MGMDISGVNNQLSQYYGVNTGRTYQTVKNEEVKGVSQGATVEISGDGRKAYDSNKKVTEDGVVTAKPQTEAVADKKDSYSVGKMSEEDRAALVKQLQAEQEKRTQSLMDMVRSVLGQQSKYALDSDESMWKFLADGNYTVDAQTKAEAEAAIAEDGYYGVKKTSERLFEFAQALAGDDVDKMKEMQKAIEKGYEMATGTWGKELPEICKNTLNAVNEKFDAYYQSKKEMEQPVI